ncbi:hypothetical protein N9H69_00615 [Flavobacteriaceae bacterium]|nr:hypothetical protein [Flavobacteriaceae bacterium]MDB3862073.1 hypothetical protein [Flavobacteriaceae bacterium]
MIRIDENEIGTISTAQYLKDKINCRNQLNLDISIDLIMDCSASILPLDDLRELNSRLLSKSKVLVVIVSTDQINTLPSEYNAVPTLKEAYDFISFERMQRDLGF